MTSKTAAASAASARLKRATQLAQAAAREMTAESPPLLSDEVLLELELLAKGSSLRAPILPPRGRSNQYYPSMSKIDSETLLVEKLVSVSGMGSIYQALLDSPESVEQLAQEAANYAISKPAWPNALQLLEQGLDLSVGSDGAFKIAIRRTADRQTPDAPERVRNRPLSLGHSEYDVSFRSFAMNAIHSRVDPRLGRLRRDGMSSTSAKTKANLVSQGPSYERPNYSQLLCEQARRAIGGFHYTPDDEAAALRQARLPESFLLYETAKKLSASVAQRARQIASERQNEWFSAAGALEPYQMAELLWGSRASLAEIDKMKAHAPSARKLLEERGALGVFSLRVARGFGIDGAPEDLVGQIKARMSSLGLSDGGWKRLNQMDPALTLEMAAGFSLPAHKARRKNFRERDEDPLRAFSQALSVGVANNLQPEVLSQLLALVGSDEHAQREFASAFASLCRPSLGEARVSSIEQAQNYIAETQAKQKLLPQVLKAFALRANQAGAAAAATELELFKDYVSSSEMGVWQQVPEGANWGQLMRLQREWHELVERRENGASLQWSSPVAQFESEESGYEARALTSGYELLQEGKAMHHCVSSYAKRCHDGDTLIFSITRSGERFGTLEIRPKGQGDHQVAQFKGLCNAVIEPKDAWAFAEQLAQLCSANARLALETPAQPKPAAP